MLRRRGLLLIDLGAPSLASARPRAFAFLVLAAASWGTGTVLSKGAVAEVPPLTFKFLELTGFSTAANSKVPHNALHDARSLRDHVLTLEP